MNGILGLAGVLYLIYLLSPRYSHCDPEAMGRAQCFNNLKQIALALEMYHEQYGTLPPAFVADANDRRLYSWRVLLLPFLDRADLYKSFDLREPWDGPNNIKLLEKMPFVLGCPSRSVARTNLTSYVAIAGPGTMFPGAAPVRLADVTDGPSRTLMLAEVADQSIPWTAPIDLDVTTMSRRINDPARAAISSKHRHGAIVAFGDARVGVWSEPIPLPPSVLTIAGGDWTAEHGEVPQPK